MPDAIAGRSDLERRVNGGIAGIGMMASEGVNSLGFKTYRDNISLAGFAGAVLGNYGGDAGSGKPCLFRLVPGMSVTPPIAVRGSRAR